MLGIIRILSVKGWYTIDQYNDALKDLRYYSYEGKDKPCQITKLKGKAVSNWVHLRNWPLVIMKFEINVDDTALNLGLLLHDIVERLCASEFLPYEISRLNEKIVDYLDLRKIVRDDYPNLMKRPKPKHHFLRKEFFLLEMQIFFK